MTPPSSNSDSEYRARLEWHRPVFYRYRVAFPGLRLGRNRYPGAWIGMALVVGRFAYCVKWGRPA